MSTLNPTDQEIPRTPTSRKRDFEWDNTLPSAPEPSPRVETQTVAAGSKTMERGEEFTPGPWFPNENSQGGWEVNIGPGRYSHTIAYIGRGCPEYFRGDPEANARLIASAPELLAAVEGLLGIARCEHNEPCQVALDRAVASIAKATGKGDA